MKCAIMQPHFLPWPGYFNLISKVDKFVFLDDAQFSKNSWHSRNKILVNKKNFWISIPVKKSSLISKIYEKKIDFSKNWQLKQKKTIIETYKNCIYINDLKELIDFSHNLKVDNLSEYNIIIIKFICSKLNFNKTFLKSSDLKIEGKRTDRIIKILEKIKATNYFSTIGSKQYLADDQFTKLTKIKLLLNEYNCKPYFQKNSKEYISNLSIIDMIANLGWTKTSTHVKNEL